MAPELIQGKRYDAKADIWSFGITAIELTQGRPPRSRESPHTVLLQTCVSRSIKPTAYPFINLLSHQRPGKTTNPRSERKCALLFPCVQGDRRCLPRQRSLETASSSCFTCRSFVTSHTHSPTAAELLQTPFFKNAKKKSSLVGTILDGLPPLTMRQERCHRPERLTTQRTTDSWDFNSTTTSFQTAPLVKPSPRIVQMTKTLSIASERNLDDDPETHGRLSKDDSAEPLREATMEPGATTSSLKSVVVSPLHPTAPIPIARRDGISPPSSYSPVVTPPNSTSSSTPPSLWGKLTRRPPRNVLADEEPPKGNSISRFLGRRSFS